ncbi:hypothetical protein [Shewanella donghaensis]|uniref:hypothetical protein n=1 Tax=Shewanella donghaensis TaxID=238836 RepID=UPI0011838FF3|nr:hypothetical protein [Shewanella donghaensis]
MSLDSLYAITARPPKQVGTFKRDVKKVSDSQLISADSHEAPQSQVPPKQVSTKQITQNDSTNSATKDLHDEDQGQHIDIEI